MQCPLRSVMKRGCLLKREFVFCWTNQNAVKCSAPIMSKHPNLVAFLRSMHHIVGCGQSNLFPTPGTCHFQKGGYSRWVPLLKLVIFELNDIKVLQPINIFHCSNEDDVKRICKLSQSLQLCTIQNMLLFVNHPGVHDLKLRVLVAMLITLMCCTKANNLSTVKGGNLPIY